MNERLDECNETPGSSNKVRLTAAKEFSWSRASHLAPSPLRASNSKLRILAPIVTGHLFCARYSCRDLMPRHTSSARAKTESKYIYIYKLAPGALIPPVIYSLGCAVRGIP